MAKLKKNAEKAVKNKNEDYIFSMEFAPRIEESTHIIQLLPIIFFGAFVIMITRMYSYERDMTQFYWSGGASNLTDFFSYFKMVAILICAVAALVLLLYRVFTQTLAIKKCFAYIPMIVYSAFVILSYCFSEYKEFAWLGYNDRFEGTAALLAYMVLLFFIINSINSERNVKTVIYPIAASSALLGLLGVSQALDHDFFRTALGQKLITPNSTVQMTEDFLSGDFGKALSDAGLIKETSYTVNQLIDMGQSVGMNFLSFTFQNREIYQTVYNINYVSFYLTLLLPLFGMLFIRSVMRGKEEPVWKKCLWGALFALLVYNLIGSASSGGFLGMALVVLMGLIVLNKRIIKWWKPVAILIVLALIMGGVTFDRWSKELTSAIGGVTGSDSQTEEAADATLTHKLRYIDTDGYDIIVGIDDSTITMTTYPDNPEAIKIIDQDGESLELVPTDVSPVYKFSDERFENCYIQPAEDEEGNSYFLFTTDGQEQNWAFRITEDGVYYLSELGKLVDLDKIEAIGWEDNQGFGSGRGYIYSRTLPMMKDTVVLGHGADTYCLYFPHKDYVGKYSAGWNLNMIVDKPHDMYMGAWIGTGGISVLALLALFGMYIVQSFRIYFRNRFDEDSFTVFAGAGIFFGICGFLFTGLVDDSTVSVMPMFYTLLGTGIAINMILKRTNPNRSE